MIGTYAETGLHAALKLHYAGDDGELEVRVGPYWIDVRRNAQLIEIQTGNFSSVRHKLASLLVDHDVLLVHPIASERHLLWLDDQDKVTKRRKSPTRGRIEDIFDQLVAFPQLVDHPRFTVRVVMTCEELLRVRTKRRKRFDRGWKSVDRKLVRIVSEHSFFSRSDFAALLPAELPTIFTVREVAEFARLPQRTAQRMVYCLRRMAVIDVVGKQGRALAYARCESGFSITQPSSPSA